MNIFVFFVSGKTDFSFDRFGARGGNTHGARQGERYVLRTLVNDVRVSDHPAFGDNDLGGRGAEINQHDRRHVFPTGGTKSAECFYF